LKDHNHEKLKNLQQQLDDERKILESKLDDVMAQMAKAEVRAQKAEKELIMETEKVMV
jgi:protein subunit release factor A